MKPRLILNGSLILFLLASCAPQPATPVADAPMAQPVISAATAAPTLEQSPQPAANPTQALAPTALPVATSRGPELEATDPATVNLASGNLHFVEFFRFT